MAITHPSIQDSCFSCFKHARFDSTPSTKSKAAKHLTPCQGQSGQELDLSPVPEAWKHQGVAQSLECIFTNWIGVGGPSKQISGPPLPDLQWNNISVHNLMAHSMACSKARQPLGCEKMGSFPPSSSGQAKLALSSTSSPQHSVQMGKIRHSAFGKDTAFEQ